MNDGAFAWNNAPRWRCQGFESFYCAAENSVASIFLHNPGVNVLRCLDFGDAIYFGIGKVAVLDWDIRTRVKQRKCNDGKPHSPRRSL